MEFKWIMVFQLVIALGKPNNMNMHIETHMRTRLRRICQFVQKYINLYKDL